MSGSTQKCRIRFYHPLSCVVVMQVLPSASPVKCVISGSVLVLVFTFTLSSAASHPQEVWMFLSHMYQKRIVWSEVGSVYSLLTQTSLPVLLCFSHCWALAASSCLHFCFGDTELFVGPCPFYSLSWLLMEAETLRRFCCWLNRASFHPCLSQ